jgi:hypothetical protein
MQIHLLSRLHIALEDDAQLLPKHSSARLLCFESSHVLGEEEDVNLRRRISIPSLNCIYQFHGIIKSQQKDSQMVVMAGRELIKQVKMSFLVACHMVMSHGLGFEECFLLLKPFHCLFEEYHASYGVSVETLLRSFCCARCLDWIDFRRSPLINSVTDVMIDKFILDERLVGD